MNLSEKINTIYNKNPFYFINGNYSDKEAKKIFLKKKLPFIPILNSKKKIVRIIISYVDYVNRTVWHKEE
mgnify:CR=1 FL=1